jgi:hypothetical protein
LHLRIRPTREITISKAPGGTGMQVGSRWPTDELAESRVRYAHFHGPRSRPQSLCSPSQSWSLLLLHARGRPLLLGFAACKEGAKRRRRSSGGHQRRRRPPAGDAVADAEDAFNML